MRTEQILRNLSRNVGDQICSKALNQSNERRVFTAYRSGLLTPTQYTDRDGLLPANAQAPATGQFPNGRQPGIHR